MSKKQHRHDKIMAHRVGKFSERIREICTVQKDNGGFYLLSAEQFAEVERAKDEAVLDKLMDIGVLAHKNEGHCANCWELADDIDEQCATLRARLDQPNKEGV